MATKTTQQVRVNTTRYLDEDGLEVLWEKIKEYVDEHSVTIEGDDIDLNGYVTTEQLEEALANIDTSDIDLSAYATKEELVLALKGCAKADHTHSQYLTEHQDLTGYAKIEDIPSTEGLATESYVTNAINNAQLGGGDGSNIDLSIYATKDDLADKADKDHTHSEYLTEHQSLDGYATETYVENAIKNAEIDVDLTDYALKSELPDLTSYATQDYVDTAIENAVIEGAEVDLSNYATKTYVDDAISEIEVTGVEDELTVKRKSDNNSIIELPYEFDETLKDTTLDPLRVYADTSTVETNFTFDKILYLTSDSLPKTIGIDEYKELTYSDNMTISGIEQDQYLTDYLIFNPKLIGENTNTIFKEIETCKTLDDFGGSIIGAGVSGNSAYIWNEDQQKITSTTELYETYEDGYVFERTLYGFHFYPDREYTITMTTGTAVYRNHGYDDSVDGWMILDNQTLADSVVIQGSARGEDYTYITGRTGDYFYIAPEDGAVFTVSDGTNTMTFNSDGIVNAPQYEIVITNSDSSESNTVVFTLTSENGTYYVRQRNIQIVTRYDMDNLGGSGGSADLSDYYTKEETYNKSEVNALIPNLTGYLKYEVVTSAPETQTEGVLYIVTG